MSLRNDISTALWFAVHPRLYPQLGRSLRRRLLAPARPADEAERAAEWCAGRAVSTTAALERLTGAPQPESVRKRHAHSFATADAKAAAATRHRMGGAGDLDLIYWLCEHTAARRAIETGVAHGWSSMTILLSLAQRDGDLVSVDMPYPFGDRREVGAVVPPWLHIHWTLIRLPDAEGVPRALRMMPVIDLCHYDSDKTYEGRMLTYPRLWDALRQGGVFISDDVGDNLAFAEFAERVGAEPTIVEPEGMGKYVGVLVKGESAA